MKAIGLWEAAKRGAMAQLVDLEIERKLLERLIENCNRHIAQGGPVVRRTGVQKVQPRAEKKHHKGLHWTQRPENRAKLLRTVRKMQNGKRKAAA